MAIVGVLTTILAGNPAPLLASLASSEAAMKGYAKGTVTGAQVAQKALLGIGIGAVVGIGIAVNAAKDFEEQMAIVNTIARETPEELAKTGRGIRDLSVATGVGLSDLTAGYYDILSVGVPKGSALEFLSNATTLGLGGLGTTEESVNAITTAINSWSVATGTANLTMADSAKVADIFAAAIEIGDIKAGEIGSALANVAPSAAAMNMSLQEVAAGWGVMTTKGFSASEAATSMDAALTALAKKPPGMEDLEKKTGKAYKQIAMTDGVQAALQQIVTDAQKFDIELNDVFGRKEALPFVRFITDSGAPGWFAALERTMNPTGAAAGQMSERMKTLDAQLRILGTSTNDLAIELGTALLPPLTSFVQSMTGVVQGASAWASANPELASTILPLTAALAGLAVVGLALPPILGAIGAGVALALSPITLILAALTAEMLILQSFADKNNAIKNANPEFTPAQISAEKYNTGTPEYRALADKRGYGPNNNFGGPAGGINGLAPPTRGEVFLPIGQGNFGGRSPDDRRPIQINNNMTVVLDGEKVGSIIQRRQYNDASAWSSGFSNPGPDPIR